MKSECSSAKRACFCARRLLALGRSLARVRDRQRGGDDEHLAHAALVVRLQDHAGQPRIDRQLRQRRPTSVIAPACVEGAELLQQRHAVAHRCAGRADR